MEDIESCNCGNRRSGRGVDGMKYMPGDYVDVDTGEACNSLVFKRLQANYEIKILGRFKKKLKNGNEERVYTTTEYKCLGKTWSGELFTDAN